MNYIVFSSDLANYPAEECIKGINDASSRSRDLNKGRNKGGSKNVTHH